MTNTQPDTSDQRLRDLLTIRDYLRDRVDELTARNQMIDALAVAKEVSWLNAQIRQAEAGQ